MKLNENTVITGELVRLVPYETRHVSKYHEWMKSQELQVLTASEQLTLEEEYEMQKSWREDSDKCTFIILNNAIFQESQDEVAAMIGDTNIFLKGGETGEIEIMIAKPSARGKGLGKEAVLLMLRYGIENLKLKKFRAIILNYNLNSIELFKKIGFVQVGENKIFDELIYERQVSDEWMTWIRSNTIHYFHEERK